MLEPKGKLVTPVGFTSAGEIKPIQVDDEGRVAVIDPNAAPKDAKFVVLEANATLTQEAVLGDNVIMAGDDADKPAAGIEGRLYCALDTGVIYRDNGTSWDQVGTSGAGGALVNPASGKGTTVWDGSSPTPTSWTDFNFSPYVGSNPAVVFLKIHNGSGAQVAFWWRRNGDTEAVNNVSSYYGVCYSVLKNTGNTVLAIMTDANGKAEWVTDTAKTGIVMKITGYIA